MSGPVLKLLGRDLRTAAVVAAPTGYLVPIFSPVAEPGRTVEGYATVEAVSAAADATYDPIGGGLAAPAQYKLATTVDLVVDFEAEGDGSDEHENIQAAVDTQRQVRVSAEDGRVFATASPILLSNGASLRGESRRLSIIRTAPGFSGDALIKSVSRDDNAVGVYESVTIEDLSISSKIAGAGAGLDITGFRNSGFHRLYFDGPGPTVAGSMAIRMSDRNPGATSHKSTFFNKFSEIDAAGAGWNKFADISTHYGDCNTIEMSVFNSYSTIGFFFGTMVSSLSMSLKIGYMLGTNVSNGSNAMFAGATPTWFSTDLVSGEGFADASFISDIDLLFSRDIGGIVSGREFKVQMLARSASGTTAASAIAPNTGTPESFKGSAYIKVVNTTALTAGLNTKAYFFNSPLIVPDSFRIDIVSGAPTVPISFMGSQSSNTFTLTLVVKDNYTLTSDLVLRVSAETDY